MREFVEHIHFVGIGGIGMSGIAEVLLDLGYRVSGSDVSRSEITRRLEQAGAELYYRHDPGHLGNADVVVYSSAILPDTPELEAARSRKVPVVPRAEMLAEIMRFRKGIAITGTHGKTTTTSLVSTLLINAGTDPTFVVGGVINSTNTNGRLGTGEFLVAEADESDASFLRLQPQIAVVTNIDRDHMETYGGEYDRLQQTYVDFLHNLPFYGLAILCFDDPGVREICEHLHRPFVSYGFSDGVDFRAGHFSQSGRESAFEVFHDGESMGDFRLSLPGRHNVLNALAVIAVGIKLGIPERFIRTALSGFEGIARRFQAFGEIHFPGHSVNLVDDYAHHPSEIQATLQAAHDCWPDRRIVVVFQPHRYTRTRDLFDDFVELLARIPALVITEVYPAGEARIPGSDGDALCRAVRNQGGAPEFAKTLEQLKGILPNLTRQDDIVITMGAGTIGQFAAQLAAAGTSGCRKTEQASA
ncbi:MAG: UDP-N-acetylmuramate--L-alanine ligase [Gammaproteobacteria bacterium]|nr:UDP-N-acetylmuramate--L-alanine ligase [Gammaproteobacteria bacterium]